MERNEKYSLEQEPQKTGWYNERNTDLNIKIVSSSNIYISKSKRQFWFLSCMTKQEHSMQSFLIYCLYLFPFGFPSASLYAHISLLCSVPMIFPDSNAGMYSRFRTWTSSVTCLYSSIILWIWLQFICCLLLNLFLHSGLLP